MLKKYNSGFSGLLCTTAEQGTEVNTEKINAHAFETFLPFLSCTPFLSPSLFFLSTPPSFFFYPLSSISPSLHPKLLGDILVLYYL